MIFTVQGTNWTKEIDIEDDFSDKYKEKAFEAMSRAVDEITVASDDQEQECGEGQYGFGPIMMAWEKDKANNPDLQIATLTEHVLRNCGHHAIAELFKKKMQEDLKEKIDKMKGTYDPTSE